MQTEEFDVMNVKCGGCVKAIQTGLATVPGVDKVEVTLPGGHVHVEGVQLSRASLGKRLSELGYPEA